MVRPHVPILDAESEPWWAAAAEERLLVRRCASCGRAHLYPRRFCPYCWSEEVLWEDASGDATLYTFAVVRFNDLEPFRAQVPYIAGIVELAEGPRLATTVVEVAVEECRIGLPLRVHFQRDKVSLPVFAPR